jgi:hypothetical protein
VSGEWYRANRCSAIRYSPFATHHSLLSIHPTPPSPAPLFQPPRRLPSYPVPGLGDRIERPISSIVPSSHSASTYQWVSSAVLIWRGLKIGRGNLGRLVDMRLADPERGAQSRRSENIGPAKERVRESPDWPAVRPRGRGDPAFAQQESLQLSKAWIPASAGMSGCGNTRSKEGSVALAGHVWGSATRHAASMGWPQAERHRKPMRLN